MFEQAWFVQGGAFPAILAAVIVLGVRAIPRPEWLSKTPEVIAIAAGFTVGFVATHGGPNFPPVESQEWFVVVALPISLVVAMAARICVAPAPLFWIMRLLIAFGLPPLLLQPLLQYTWSLAQAVTWLTLLGLANTTVWVLLSRPVKPHHGQPFPRFDWVIWMLTIVVGATGITTMLSGSQTLAQVTLSLAVTCAAIGAIGVIWPNKNGWQGSIDIALPMLIMIWLNGYFYAEVIPIHAILLGLSPLAVWMGEIDPWKRWSPSKNAMLRLIAVTAIVTLVVVHAAIKFQQDSTMNYYG